MTRWLRWQWLWKSRKRLLTVGLVALALGVVALLALIMTGPPEVPRSAKGYFLSLFGSVWLAGYGGWLTLQALLSNRGAFGSSGVADDS